MTRANGYRTIFKQGWDSVAEHYIGWAEIEKEERQSRGNLKDNNQLVCIRLHCLAVLKLMVGLVRILLSSGLTEVGTLGRK